MTEESWRPLTKIITNSYSAVAPGLLFICQGDRGNKSAIIVLVYMEPVLVRPECWLPDSWNTYNE